MSLREQLQLFDAYLRNRFPELAEVLSSAEARRHAPPDDLVTAELLAPVVAAASDARVSVARNAAWVLWVLTGFFTAAQEAVARMAQDPRAHVRHHAMVSVGKLAPLPLKLEVLGRGLRDRSARVREKAADRARASYVREITPELESAAARERNAAIKRRLERVLGLLRDGYFVSPARGAEVEVVIAVKDGTASYLVSRAELKARGVEALVMDFFAKDRHEHWWSVEGGGWSVDS